MKIANGVGRKPGNERFLKLLVIVGWFAFPISFPIECHGQADDVFGGNGRPGPLASELLCLRIYPVLAP